MVRPIALRRVMLKSLIVTRRKAPKLAKKIVKSTVLSSVAEALVHHKPPTGDLVIDVTVIESLETCIKIVSHHLVL